MKLKLLFLLAALALFTTRAVTLAAPPPAEPSPLPPVEDIMKKVLEQADKEGEFENAFRINYSFTREKLQLFKNGRGVVKRTKARTKINDPIKYPVPAVTNSDPNAVNRPYDTSDFPVGEDLLARFSFTLVGREMVNGRPAFVIDFKPADKDLSEKNIKEKCLNRAAGRAWVDEADSVIVKASVYLTKPVSIVGGLVGAVHKFTFHFIRQRTPEGIWFTRNYDWHLEGREVIVDRIIDFNEETKDVIRVTPTNSGAASPAAAPAR